MKIRVGNLYEFKRDKASFIDKGAYGRVYRGNQIDNPDNKVAIKVLTEIDMSSNHVS